MRSLTELMFQLGTSGGVQATGYSGIALSATNGNSVSGDNPTSAFRTASSNAAAVFHGRVVFSLLNATTNTWACSGHLYRSDDATADVFGGSVSLSAVLDRVRMTSGNGTAAFDAGSVNITYET